MSKNCDATFDDGIIIPEPSILNFGQSGCIKAISNG